MSALNKKLKTKKSTSGQKKKEKISPVCSYTFLVAKHNNLERQKSTQKIHNNQIMSTKALAEVIFFLLRNFSQENGGGGCYLLGLNPMAQKLYRLIGPRCVLAWVESKKAKEHKAIKPYAFRRPHSHPSYEEALLHSIV